MTATQAVFGIPGLILNWRCLVTTNVVQVGKHHQRVRVFHTFHEGGQP